MAFVSFGVIVVSIFVLGIFLMITVNVQSILSAVKEKVEIEAFLRDGLNDEDVSMMRIRIMAVEGVNNVFYTSKDEAMKIYREDLKGNPDLLEAIETNPFPASFSVRLLPAYRNEERTSAIAKKIEGMEGVEEVEYGKEWVGRLDDVARILVIVDVAVGAIIALSCLFLVFNTIRLTVFARREEIEIMSLVGATDSFIKSPFLLVGFFYGLVGGVLASALLYAVHWAIAIKIPAIKFLDLSYLGGLVAFAALLGYLGSVFSVRRFLAA